MHYQITNLKPLSKKGRERYCDNFYQAIPSIDEGGNFTNIVYIVGRLIFKK